MNGPRTRSRRERSEESPARRRTARIPGDIDEANEETQDEGFADFLAKTDIDKVAREKPKPTPAKEEGK